MNNIDHWTTITLIALAIVVTVPLARRTVGLTNTATSRLAGIAVVVSLVTGPGPLAAALATPWLALAVRDFARGAVTLHTNRTLDRCGTVLVLGWITNAAVWLWAHRLGLEPLGFDRVTTLLTVAHFHHAGVGLVALLVGAYRYRPQRRLVGAIALHQIGMITVAAGITLGSALDASDGPAGWLEPVGALAIIGALVIWTATAFQLASTTHRPTRRLLQISGLAWAVPMVLALGWAAGPLLPQPVVTTFRVMLTFHATIQAIGLVICGLAAITLLMKPATTLHPTDTSIGVRHAVHP